MMARLRAWLNELASVVAVAAPFRPDGERELGGYGLTRRCDAPVVAGRPWCLVHWRHFQIGKRFAGRRAL